MFEKILSPTLIIDKKKCLENIQTMAAKAKKHHLTFRPHFKTHQSKEIGSWFREAGINQITVSSLSMGQYFAEHGWKDITLAIPFNIRETEKAAGLAKHITLNLLIDSCETASVLRDRMNHRFGFFIEIDAGDHRTGVEIPNKHKIDKILTKIEENPHAIFKGFLLHAGNTYRAGNKEEILKIHETSLSGLINIKNHYTKYFKDLIISIGDTPSCSLANHFEPADEIRPGNFVFYDWMQYQLGVCALENIAVQMLCPVIGKYPHRKEVVVHGGAVHFSKEYLVNHDGTKNFGQVITMEPSPKVVEDCYLASLSQEHGIIKCSEAFLEQIKTGDLVAIFPIHSCLTMNLMKEQWLTI